MSSRDRREWERGALTAAAGGVAASAVWWWWHAYSLRRLIEQYEKNFEDCSYALSENYRKDPIAFNDKLHVDHETSRAEAVKLSKIKKTIESNFMADLKALAHMPPVIDHEAAI
jgi:hypothetical protein